MKLPLNCEVNYIDDFLSKEEADDLFSLLINKYEIDKARLIVEAGGQLIKTDSFKFFFSISELVEKNSHPEEIHGKSFVCEGIMAELKNKVEVHLNRSFDLAMCLYYPDGNFFAPYHSDQETSGYNTILPSISLGGVRTFSFRSLDDGNVHNMELNHGSLLVMGAHCQSRYEHSLLKNSAFEKDRINITFRDRNFM